MPRSRQPRAMSVTPKASANTAMSHSTLRMPAPGKMTTQRPKRAEITPAMARNSSPLMCSRRRMAVQISKTPVRIAHAPTRSTSTKAVMTGHTIARNPATSPAIPWSRETHQPPDPRALHAPVSPVTPSMISQKPKSVASPMIASGGKNRQTSPNRIAMTPRRMKVHHARAMTMASVTFIRILLSPKAGPLALCRPHDRMAGRVGCGHGVEKPLGSGRDLLDSGVEGGLVGRRGPPVAAHLADVLEGCGAHLVGLGWDAEVAKGLDAATHVRSLRLGEQLLPRVDDAIRRRDIGFGELRNGDAGEACRLRGRDPRWRVL